MKKLIYILMMLSLPAMAITPDAARTLLQSHGIDPTVIADLSGISMPDAVSGLIDGSLVLNSGTTGTFSEWTNPFNGWSSDYGVRFTIADSKDSRGQFNSVLMGTISGSEESTLFVPSFYTDYGASSGRRGNSTAYDDLKNIGYTVSWSAQNMSTYIKTGLFDGSDSVITSIGDDVAEIIKGKAISLKPVMRELAFQTSASALGQGAHIACQPSVAVQTCFEVGEKFQSIAGQLNFSDGNNLIDSDHIMYLGTRYEPAYDANMSGGDLGYRPVGGGGASGMQWLITNGGIWSPEETHTGNYNDSLEVIGDLSDVLITFDGLTFEDLFTP